MFSTSSHAAILRITGLTFLTLLSFVNHIMVSNFAITSEQPQNDAPVTKNRWKKPTDAPHTATSRAPLLLSAGDALLDPVEWDMSPVVIEDYKLIFFTQPKVGCTVFKQLFRRMAGKSNWMAENCCGKLPWNPETNGLTYLSHYNATAASRMLQDPTYTKAVFVRDPVTRFLSAYLDKAVRNPFFLQQKCATAYQQQRRESAILSMEDFYVLAQQCDNPHWRSQVQRLPKPEYWKSINFVGYLEHAQEDTERLLRRIGAWEALGASGWGRDGQQAVFEGSTGRHHATSAVSKRARYITPQLEARLRTELYAEDYRHPVFARYNEL